MKLNYKKTLILGLGFFAASIAWPIYNTYVPIFLEKYLDDAILIGTIMTFDNIFAVIFQPLFGALSDRTRTRYGRRMPFLLVGVPLAALFFSLIPFEFNLVSLIVFVILMNFSMSIYRAPTVALMPDVTPRPLRSKANGVINLMGGLAAIIAYGLGGVLYKVDAHLPFFMGSVVMMIAVIVLYNFIKEPKETEDEKDEPQQIKKDVQDSKGLILSLIFILLAIFFWFCSFNAMETFFSLYGVHVLGIQEADASILLTFFSLFFLVSSIPAGLLGTKFGRKRTIMAGILGMLAMSSIMIFTRNIAFIRVLLVLGGFFWALININSYPMVVEMATSKGTGTYTGYYYFFSSAAAVLSPILFGWIADLAGSYMPLFIYSSSVLIAALFFMMLVRHGEAANTKSQDALEMVEEM